MNIRGVNMNSRELYNMFENMKDNEIETMAFMSVRYLVKKRNKNLKELLQNIKNLNKALDKGVNYE